MGDPQNGWFIGENPIKMDDLGVHPFQKTSKGGDTLTQTIAFPFWMNHKAVAVISKRQQRQSIENALLRLLGVLMTGNRMFVRCSKHQPFVARFPRHHTPSFLSFLFWRFEDVNSFVKSPSPWHNFQDTYSARQAGANSIWLVLGNPLRALEHALPAILCPAAILWWFLFAAVSRRGARFKEKGRAQWSFGWFHAKLVQNWCWFCGKQPIFQL